MTVPMPRFVRSVKLQASDSWNDSLSQTLKHTLDTELIVRQRNANDAGVARKHESLVSTAWPAAAIMQVRTCMYVRI